MEGFNETILSAEQQKRQEKCEKILSIINSLAESLTDSKDADNLADSIAHFGNKFNKENKNIELGDYSLGRALLYPGEVAKVLDNISNYEHDDTEDGRIEKFITKIFEETKMTSKRMARSKKREEKLDGQQEELAA